MSKAWFLLYLLPYSADSRGELCRLTTQASASTGQIRASTAELAVNLEEMKAFFQTHCYGYAMRLTLSNKMYGITGSLLAALVLVSAITYISQESIQARYKETRMANAEQLLAISGANEQLDRAALAYHAFLLHGDPDAVRMFHTASGAISECIDRYARASGSDAEREFARQAQAELTTFSGLTDSDQQQLRPVGVSVPVGEGQARQLRAALNTMAIAAETAQSRRNRNAGAAAHYLHQLQACLIIAAAGAGLWFGAITVRNIARSLHEEKAALYHQ